MHADLLIVGKIKDNRVSVLVEEYCYRISRFFPCAVKAVREVRHGDEEKDPSRIVAEESRRLLKSVPPKSFCVLLDRAGREFDSPGFSDLVASRMAQANRDGVFVVGGFLGVDETVHSRADEVVSLSRMTLTHELALLFLAEQVFRAVTIMKRIPYHK